MARVRYISRRVLFIRRSKIVDKPHFNGGTFSPIPRPVCIATTIEAQFLRAEQIFRVSGTQKNVAYPYFLRHRKMTKSTYALTFFSALSSAASRVRGADGDLVWLQQRRCEHVPAISVSRVCTFYVYLPIYTNCTEEWFVVDSLSLSLSRD